MIRMLECIEIITLSKGKVYFPCFFLRTEEIGKPSRFDLEIEIISEIVLLF